MSWDIPQPLCPLPDCITGPERKVRKVHTSKSIPFLFYSAPTGLQPYTLYSSPGVSLKGLIFLLGVDSTWADGNSYFTPMQPSNPHLNFWFKSRIYGGTLSKLSVPWCVLAWAKFKPPELRARGRRNALANVTENIALTYQMVQSYNTQLPSDCIERLPIVNERIGLAWNGEQALTGSAERTTTRGEPAFTPMLWPLLWTSHANSPRPLLPFCRAALSYFHIYMKGKVISHALLELKRTYTYSRFPSSFFWSFLLLAKETSGGLKTPWFGKRSMINPSVRTSSWSCWYLCLGLFIFLFFLLDPARNERRPPVGGLLPLLLPSEHPGEP